MKDDPPRCKERDSRTGKQCILMEMHNRRTHRWWRVHSKERPTWQEGIGRIEWLSGEESYLVPRGAKSWQ